MAERLVSIAIIAHNDWPDLDRAIDSALNQTHRAAEVIVVDNGSTDATPIEVPRRYGRLVNYRRQANRGHGAGYNAGLDVASGGFVQWLDGDDYLAPDKIERQLAVFADDPKADVVYGDVLRFAGGLTWAEWSCRDEPDMLAALLAEDGRGGGLVMHSVLFARGAIQRIGRWDERLRMADADYWLRAAWAGCRFRYCPGSLCFYQRRPGQMSADADAMARGLEAVWEKALTYIDTEPYRGLIARRLARHRYVQALAGDGTARERAMKLQRARGASPSAVPLRAYVAARVLISLPGGRALARSDALKRVRGVAAQMLGVK